MKAINLNDRNNNEITIERARELLNDYEISDTELTEILQNIKTFCEITYDIFRKQQEAYNSDEENQTELRQAA